MVSWLPPHIREIYLYVPFPHGIEMIRAAVFGEFIPTYYNPLYALAVGAIFNILGLLLIAGARDRTFVE
jgi:capsular polysaccharide transport system permease protein